MQWIVAVCKWGVCVGAPSDSIREMYRYQGEVNAMGPVTPEVNRISTHMKLFRSQRNFYMAGFVLLGFL